MKTQFPLEPEEEDPQSYLAFAPPVQLQAFNCSSHVVEVSCSSSLVGNVSFLHHFCIQDLILDDFILDYSYSSVSIRVANILQMWRACSVQCCQASSVSLTFLQLLLIVSARQKTHKNVKTIGGKTRRFRCRIFQLWKWSLPPHILTWNFMHTCTLSVHERTYLRVLHSRPNSCRF